MRVEVDQIVKSNVCIVLVGSELGVVDNPLVFESLSGRWTLSSIKGQKFGDKIFGISGNALPNLVVKIELTFLDGTHDSIVRSTIKWRDTRQEDVAHDTKGPDITFLVVLLGKNFWSNVVWSTNSFSKLVVWIIRHGGTKINNFHLVEVST